MPTDNHVVADNQQLAQEFFEVARSSVLSGGHKDSFGKVRD